MLLNQFEKTYTEKDGWVGPMETKNGKLKIQRMLDKPYVSKRATDGGNQYKYTETKYFTFYNCSICDTKAISAHFTKGTKNKHRICEDNSIAGKGLTCHYLINAKTLKGNGRTSSRENLTTRGKHQPYPGWYQSVYDKNGMFVKTYFVYMHRIIAEEEILGRPLRKNESVHHIDMDKGNYDKNNLWVCYESQHQIAHASFNNICAELYHNFHRYKDIKFDRETGKYYLINNEIR